MQQRKDALRYGVGGCQDARARLRQDLRPCQFRRFLGEISISDARFAGGHVFQRDAQRVHVRLERVLLERAQPSAKHGDLTEGSGFATIAAKLRTAVERLGLTPYGEKGEPFDPQIHEAIFQQPTPGVTADTVAEVVETGYRLGSTVVRVAKVVVATPA